MTRLWKHILPLVAVVVFASCSSRNEAEVIPRGKMADIYLEMFMTDQWISSTPGMRTIADTSLVYEPILQKYGYGKLDYMHSVEYYMNDPERFAGILRTTVERLDKKIAHLQQLQKIQESADEAARRLERFIMDYTFEEYFPYMADEPYIHYYDSLTFEPDSLLVYRLVPIETADTLYEGLEMVVRVDSLESLESLDSLSVCDSIVAPKVVRTEVGDSLLKRKMLSDNKKLWQLSE